VSDERAWEVAADIAQSRSISLAEGAAVMVRAAREMETAHRDLTRILVSAATAFAAVMARRRRRPWKANKRSYG